MVLTSKKLTKDMKCSLLRHNTSMFLTLDWHKNIEDALQEALHYLIQPM